MGELASELKLCICAGGIYTCYLAYGVLQEWLYKYRSEDGEGFTATFFLLLVQCGANCAFAAVSMLLFGAGKRDAPAPPSTKFACVCVCRRPRSSTPLGPPLSPTPFPLSLRSGSPIALSYVGAMLCSNEALKYVNYPTQALGKSCKMVPVMLFKVLIQGKKYTFFEYMNVFAVAGGITYFKLASGKSGGADNSAFGIGLLVGSLCLDGVTGALQDSAREDKRYKATVHETMFWTNFWACVAVGVANVATGQFSSGLSFVMANPTVAGYLGLFSLASALGQNFIFMTINWFDSLVCTTVTTTRKFFTILVSVLAFGHSLKNQEWVGVGIVFAGLTGEVVNKYQKKASKQSGKKA